MKQKIKFNTWLIAIMLASILFPGTTWAQWGFTVSQGQRGNCTGCGDIQITVINIGTIPVYGFPTRQECEAARQSIAGISQTFVCGCTLYIICSSCTGRDLPGVAGSGIEGGMTNPDITATAQVNSYAPQNATTDAIDRQELLDNALNRSEKGQSGLSSLSQKYNHVKLISSLSEKYFKAKTPRLFEPQPAPTMAREILQASVWTGNNANASNEKPVYDISQPEIRIRDYESIRDELLDFGKFVYEETGLKKVVDWVEGISTAIGIGTDISNDDSPDAVVKVFEFADGKVGSGSGATAGNVMKEVTMRVWDKVTSGIYETHKGNFQRVNEIHNEISGKQTQQIINKGIYSTMKSDIQARKGLL